MVNARKRPGRAVAATRPVEGLIHVIRGQKVMLDVDLAELYGVPTKHLNQAVRRNLNRFPAKFMFQLSVEEGNKMRSQFVTASKINIIDQPLEHTRFFEIAICNLKQKARTNRRQAALFRRYRAGRRAFPHRLQPRGEAARVKRPLHLPFFQPRRFY
jgi:hypothetical protein